VRLGLIFPFDKNRFRMHNIHGRRFWPRRSGATGTFTMAVTGEKGLIPRAISGAQAGTLPREERVATYGAQFMAGLALLGTRRKHVNVLHHLGVSESVSRGVDAAESRLDLIGHG
jgi:hypothetical protein